MLTELQAATPTLTGSMILFTKAASPNDGLDVVLSEDLRTNVPKAIIGNCQEVDTQCVRTIKDLLMNRNTRLKSRQVGPEIVAGATLAGFLAIVYAMLGKTQSEQAVPVAIHVPSVQLNPAVSAARAHTFAAITKSDSPILTITPTPVVATVTGPDRPTYTFLSNDRDGHSSGDLAINLEEELAARITDEIRQHQQCDSGQPHPVLPPVNGAGVNIAKTQIGVANIAGQIDAIVCAA